MIAGKEGRAGHDRAQRRLPYVIKKERNGAGEITVGLYPAAKR